MTAKKILFLVGDFVEDYEILVPFQMLLMVGHTCHTVCPDKKSGELGSHGHSRFRRPSDLQRKARPSLSAERGTLMRSIRTSTMRW